jgi:2-keto-4-pentenoate hydratase/2-oxohepta-3-ene-1,7-dioic acid hydratase in catechol pathway
MFSKTSGAVAGYGDEVEIPKFIQDYQADYEGELAFIIAKDAKNVKREDALDFVLGYTCSDDVSARLVRDQRWASEPLS